MSIINKGKFTKKIMKNNQKQIISIVIVIAVLVLGAVLLKNKKPVEPIQNPEDISATAGQAESSNINLKAISANDHILGNKEASVIVLEFSDTQCPFCQRFHETMHKVMEEKGEQIAWAYRHFPIPQLHPNSESEANATECAWEQGGDETFWKYIDLLYKTASSANNSDMTKLTKFAKEIGLDEAKFNACVKDKKFADKVQLNVQDANNAGVNGTPKSFIIKNGKIVDTIEGAYPYEVVIEKINKALAE
jgi:protein-disulfide isomerase